MKILGYIDGKKSFVRDDVTEHDIHDIAGYIVELAEFQKKRLVLFIEHKGITHMIQRQANGGW